MIENKDTAKLLHSNVQRVLIVQIYKLEMTVHTRIKSFGDLQIP